MMNTMLSSLTETKLFNLELVNIVDFTELILRFSFNLAITIVIVRYLYYVKTKRKDYLFTYILIGSIVFLLCFLLESVKLQLGFALGLFAIFGIIRYRTNTVPIKEMTYLFIVIGISVINALTNKKISYLELVFTNFSIIFIIWLLEKVLLLRHATVKIIIYEKIELLKPENKKLLKRDLEERTGLKVEKIEVGKIDFSRDVARIKISYFDPDNQVNSADDEDVIDDME